MIYESCSENDKKLTKIFRIKGVNSAYNNIMNVGFNDALNGTITINLKMLDGTIGPLLPKNAIVRSTLINFYGYTSQKTEKSNEYISIPLQARVSDVYQYHDYTGISSVVTIAISGPKIEDETTLTAKREQLVDFDLVVIYTLLEY